ncbi:MAG: cytochrome c maturation protein CcmE [Longimicrobiales bacterium]
MRLGSTRKYWLMGAALVVGAFGYVMVGGIGDNLVWFLTPSELHAKGAAAYDRDIRLGGQVVPGSVLWDAHKLDLRFRVTDGAQIVTVQSRKAPPQMFREGQGVVVEGSLTRAGVFESTNLMVKHSNEYKAPPADHAKPAELYKSLVREPGS